MESYIKNIKINQVQTEEKRKQKLEQGHEKQK